MLCLFCTRQLSKTSGAHRRPMMYESFFLISCSKFAIMQVSTSNRQEPKPFLSSDKESLFLPDDMNSFLLDFTSYYYIGYRNIPGKPFANFQVLKFRRICFHFLSFIASSCFLSHLKVYFCDGECFIVFHMISHFEFFYY